MIRHITFGKDLVVVGFFIENRRFPPIFFVQVDSIHAHVTTKLPLLVCKVLVDQRVTILVLWMATTSNVGWQPFAAQQRVADNALRFDEVLFGVVDDYVALAECDEDSSAGARTSAL